MAAAVRPLDRWSPWFVRLHDAALAGMVMWAVLAIRYHFEDHAPPPGMIARAVLVFTLVSVVVFQLFRLHAGLWRLTTLNDAWRVFRAVVTANLLLLPILFAWDRLNGFPRSTPFTAVAALTVVLCFGRWLAHAYVKGDWRAGLRFENGDKPAALLVASAGAARAFVQSRGRAERPYRLSGLVALDGSPPGRSVAGVEVLGPLSRLEDLIHAIAARDGAPPQIVLAEPRPTRELLDGVVSAAARGGAAVVRARPAGAGGGAALTPLQAADLLARPPRAIDPERARGLLAGKRVLVTGAGGTIGSELTRQAAALGPERLILIDASEFNLYALDQELKESGCPAPWTAELADVRDENRVRKLFDRHAPQVVLHAAALKHVPLMEAHPSEAVLTNVWGAVTVAKLARDACDAFVFISTDKAVNPTNVMGATKRVAERAVQSVMAGGRCRVAAVRFGNVLGSSGSVVPLFERQLAHGGPLTVTAPDMLRYFMTVNEAAGLALAAGGLPARPGEGCVYVLEMGDPVRIDDLARQLIRLNGLTPDDDVAVAYTGLRPGEKLSEEIFYAAEDVRPTAVDGVLTAVDAVPPWSEMQAGVDALVAAARARSDEAVMAALKALEPAFKPG